MSVFEVTRQRMLAAWRWEASRLCQADAQAELASTINAMRSIMLFAAPFATELAVASLDIGDKIVGPPTLGDAGGPE